MSECASIQSTPPGAVDGRQAAERSERDRVVAAEHERKRARASSPRPRARAIELARVVDLGQEPRPLVAQRRRLGDGRLDVALVAHVVAEADETLLETRVPDRRRPHVDAAPALAEVERRADDRDLAALALTRGTYRATRLH